MKIALRENIALLLHPHVNVPWSLVVTNITLDGKLCLRHDKKCCLCITSLSLAMVGEPGKRHNVHAQQQEVLLDWLNQFSLGTMSGSAYIENLA